MPHVKGTLTGEKYPQLSIFLYPGDNPLGFHIYVFLISCSHRIFNYTVRLGKGSIWITLLQMIIPIDIVFPVDRPALYCFRFFYGKNGSKFFVFNLHFIPQTVQLFTIRTDQQTYCLTYKANFPIGKYWPIILNHFDAVLSVLRDISCINIIIAFRQYRYMYTLYFRPGTGLLHSLSVEHSFKRN